MDPLEPRPHRRRRDEVARIHDEHVECDAAEPDGALKVGAEGGDHAEQAREVERRRVDEEEVDGEGLERGLQPCEEVRDGAEEEALDADERQVAQHARDGERRRREETVVALALDNVAPLDRLAQLGERQVGVEHDRQEEERPAGKGVLGCGGEAEEEGPDRDRQEEVDDRLGRVARQLGSDERVLPPCQERDLPRE